MASYRCGFAVQLMLARVMATDVDGREGRSSASVAGFLGAGPIGPAPANGARGYFLR
jgi:hypothetical protein